MRRGSWALLAALALWLAIRAPITAGPAEGANAAAEDEPKIVLTADEKKLLELTNAERAKAKLPALVPNPTLLEVARAHAANMARQGKMEHVLDGQNQFQRIKGAGYQYAAASENIARGTVEMSEIVKNWMASPPHRKTLLGTKYTETGVGIARGADDILYYSQVFASPLPRESDNP